MKRAFVVLTAACIALSGCESAEADPDPTADTEEEVATYDDGYDDGYDSGLEDGFADGHEQGLTDGFSDGYEEGYADALEAVEEELDSNYESYTDDSSSSWDDVSDDGYSSVYYENCDAARADGAAPVYIGGPGYGDHLDRDGDGVGCE